MEDKPFVLAGKQYNSRLIIGTGKYESYAQNAEALKASGAEIITVAMRRVNLSNPDEPMLVDHISPDEVTFMPNTAGCFTAEDAENAEIFYQSKFLCSPPRPPRRALSPSKGATSALKYAFNKTEIIWIRIKLIN